MFTLKYELVAHKTIISLLWDGVVGVSYNASLSVDSFKTIRTTLTLPEQELVWRDNDAAKRIRFALALKSISLDEVGPVSVGGITDLFDALAIWHQCREDYEKIIESMDKDEGMLFSTSNNRFCFCFFLTQFYDKIEDKINDAIIHYTARGYSPHTGSRDTLFKEIFFSSNWVFFDVYG